MVLDWARGRLLLSHAAGVTALDAGTLEVVEEASLPLGASSRALALDPTTGAAYLGGEAGGLWRAAPQLQVMQALP